MPCAACDQNKGDSREYRSVVNSSLTSPLWATGRNRDSWLDQLPQFVRQNLQRQLVHHYRTTCLGALFPSAGAPPPGRIDQPRLHVALR